MAHILEVYIAPREMEVSSAVEIEDGRFDVYTIRFNPDSSIVDIRNSCKESLAWTPRYWTWCPKCGGAIQYDEEMIGEEVRHIPDGERGICDCVLTLIPVEV